MTASRCFKLMWNVSLFVVGSCWRLLLQSSLIYLMSRASKGSKESRQEKNEQTNEQTKISNACGMCDVRGKTAMIENYQQVPFIEWIKSISNWQMGVGSTKKEMKHREIVGNESQLRSEREKYHFEFAPNWSIAFERICLLQHTDLLLISFHMFGERVHLFLLSQPFK